MELSHLYFCVFQLAFTFMYGVSGTQAWAVCKVILKLMRTTVEYWLQRMALNGRNTSQWSVHTRLAGYNVLALKVTPVETYRLEVLQALGIYLLTSSYLNTSGSALSMKLHCWYIRVRSNRIRWHAISYFLDWKLGCALVQTRAIEEPSQKNFTFSLLWQKVLSISKVK